MIRGSPAFERNLKSRIRAEVRANPLLSQEYRLYRLQRFWVRLARIAGHPTLEPVGGLYCGLIIACGGALILFLVVSETVAQPPSANKELLGLATHAILLTGGLLLSIVTLQQEICRYAIPMAYLPVSERWHLESLFAETRSKCILFSCSFSLPIFTYIAGTNNFSQAECLLLAAIAVIQAWSAFNISLLASRYARNAKILVGGAVVLFLLGLLFLAATSTMPTYASEIELIVFTVTPAGWLDGAIYHAMFQHEPLGWLFLAPAMLVILRTTAQRTGFRIREFTVSVSGHTLPIFGDDDRPLIHCGNFPALPGGPARNLVPAKMNTETLDEVDVERMIRSEAFISDTNGIPKDFFARSARRLLSSRDLLLCEAMNHRLPSGREQLLWGVGITAFTVLMLFIDGQEWRVLGMGLATAVFLSAGLLMMSSWTDPSAVRAGTFHAVLPVRVDEVVRATLKWTVLRCLCHAPLAIILGVWLAIEAGASYWDGITAGIVPLLTLIALRSSLTCISVSMDTNDTRYWRIYGVWGMFIFICFVGIPAALCGPASVAWSAFGVIGISSLAVVRYYARFISRRKVDFIRRPLH